MIDLPFAHFMLVALVALVVIGPKDLPKAMRVLGYWVGKARGVARQFRTGFDAMVREAELEEMEKKWAAENARILAEHPASEPADDAAGDAPVEHPATEPVMVEQPRVEPADPPHAPPAATTSEAQS